MQRQNISGSDTNEGQFNNNSFIQQMCEVVASYYLVQSVTDDNTTSSLLSALEKSASNALQVWVSVLEYLPTGEGPS